MIKQLLFSLSLLVGLSTNAQNWHLDTIGQLPEPISNNAIVYGMYQNTPHAFSFSGIGYGKTYTDINLKGYRCNLVSGVCDTIASLPDTLGKVAAGASRVGDIIYIIGGYHVFADGSEKSSELVHRFHIPSQTFLADGAPIPVPIDDHVQVVWRDSLIYCITGWSENQNVNDVQVYDIVNDQWLVGTPVPGINPYESFGASGTIVNDTIFYFGGALFGIDFPAQSELRSGVIDPANPLAITWDFSVPDATQKGYRMASATVEGKAYWFGGSGITYNYDGIAYNGSGGVPTQGTAIHLTDSNTWYVDSIPGLPMDLRGVAQASAREFYFMGGMINDQEVSDQLLRLTWRNPIGIADAELSQAIRIYPNPVMDVLNIELAGSDGQATVYSIDGRVVMQAQLNTQTQQLTVGQLPAGLYLLVVEGASQKVVQRIIKH